MKDDDVMLTVVIQIRRDGVVTSLVEQTPELNPNIADLMAIGALDVVAQTWKAQRKWRIDGGEGKG